VRSQRFITWLVSWSATGLYCRYWLLQRVTRDNRLAALATCALRPARGAVQPSAFAVNVGHCSHRAQCDQGMVLILASGAGCCVACYRNFR